MEIKRERYLSQLKQFSWDGMVKVVTGIRRSGKSYLLNVLFRNYLKEQGVDEDHILTGNYDLGELTRVKQAAKIIEEYSGYFIIEEISDPNLQNVEATIRKYATVDEVKYVFFDYIHSTASMINQFSKNNKRQRNTEAKNSR